MEQASRYCLSVCNRGYNNKTGLNVRELHCIPLRLHCLITKKPTVWMKRQRRQLPPQRRRHSHPASSFRRSAPRLIKRAKVSWMSKTINAWRPWVILTPIPMYVVNDCIDLCVQCSKRSTNALGLPALVIIQLTLLFLSSHIGSCICDYYSLAWFLPGRACIKQKIRGMVLCTHSRRWNE
jgi:hypothetical protein